MRGERRLIPHYIGIPREVRLAFQREALRRAEQGDVGASIPNLIREVLEGWAAKQAAPDDGQER